MKVIQDILGHADISTTMNIYADATEEYKKKELESFSSYLEQMKGQEEIERQEEADEQDS